MALLKKPPSWFHTFHFGNYDALTGRRLTAERLLCRRATHLVAVSNQQRASILRRHRLEPARISTIVNGVGANPLTGDSEAIRRRRFELGFSPQDIVVGSVAVLSEQKGVSYLIAAAHRLAARDSRLRFLIVGGGRLEAELREQARSLGQGPRMVFTGWRSDGAELVAAMDVFVMSSLWEAMPMALLEAMASRRPIVVTDVGDNRSVVADGRAGVLVPPADTDALAGAIDAVVASPDRARALAEAAYAEYVARFSVDRMVADHEALYEAWSSGSRRTRVSAATSPDRR
jgi:glycosyltransferase involved in cell wall biosynthesis